jgi:hypothetical protein
MNPLFVLPQLTLEEDNEEPAVFSPTLMTNYDSIFTRMEKMDDTVGDRLAKDIGRFVNAVIVGKVSTASSLIASIYMDKYLLVKTLLETAIQYIHIKKARVVNSIFELTDLDMSPLDVIIVVRLLCQARKSDRPYIPTLEQKGTIEDMIEEAGDKCNKYYLKLKYCDKKYWSYPRHLLANAKDGVGEQFAEAEANKMDEKRAEVLEESAL